MSESCLQAPAGRITRLAGGDRAAEQFFGDAIPPVAAADSVRTPFRMAPAGRPAGGVTQLEGRKILRRRRLLLPRLDAYAPAVEMP